MKKNKEGTTIKTLPKSMYGTGELYSFTVNPAQQFFKHNSITRPRLCVAHICDLLEPLKGYCEYELYPELSKKGRWHYHGKLKILDPFHFHLTIIPKLLDKVILEIDIINDIEEWERYIKKDREVMEKALKKMKIPYRISHLTKQFKQIDVIKKTTMEEFLDKL